MARWWLIGSVAAALALGCTLIPDAAGAVDVPPDFSELSWKQWIAWGFRAPGIIITLLLGLALWSANWVWFRGKYPRPSHPVDSPPSPLPAPVVSILEGREVTGRTLLALIAEMCQQGKLEVAGVRTAARTASPYFYRFEQREPPEHDWERLALEKLAGRTISIENLHRSLEAAASDIGNSLGDYLWIRGAFSENPVQVKAIQAANDRLVRIVLALTLMGTGVGLWLSLWVPQWWVGAIVGGIAGLIYGWIIIPTRVGMVTPSDAGKREIGQWLAFRKWLRKALNNQNANPPDNALLPYAIALDAAKPWLDGSVAAPCWFRAITRERSNPAHRHEAYHFLVSASQWGLEGRSDEAAEVARRRHNSESVSEAAEAARTIAQASPAVAAEPIPATPAAAAAGYVPPRTVADRTYLHYRDAYVSRNYLQLGGKRVRMNQVRSAEVGEVGVAVEASSNRFLTGVGNGIAVLAGLGVIGIAIIFGWAFLFTVTEHYGITQPSEFCGPYGGCPGDVPITEVWIEWLGSNLERELGIPSGATYWMVLGSVAAVLLVVAWLGHLIARLGTTTTATIKYRARAQVEGEWGPIYSEDYDERAEAERVVAAIEQAIAANRFGNL